MTTLEFAIRIGVALLLGTAIGFEREWRHKSAGLRTNTLVCMGSCAFVLFSYHIGGDATGRIASYVISGIGFLGAGVIMKDGLSVRGLNTAATIWCSGAVGSIIAAGLYIEASIVAGAIMFTHVVLRPISSKLNKVNFKNDFDSETDYLIKIKCKDEVENRIRILLIQFINSHKNFMLKSLSSDDESDNPGYVFISAEIICNSNNHNLVEEIASRLTIEEKVQKVSWEILGSRSDM